MWKKAKVPILIGQEKVTPLQNYQIIIEGIWGDGRVGFERDACWERPLTWATFSPLNSRWEPLQWTI